MKPIWYFVGLFLLLVGVIVTAAGLYDFLVPPAEHTVLGYLHPALWWGMVIVAAGAVFYAANRHKTVE